MWPQCDARGYRPLRELRACVESGQPHLGRLHRAGGREGRLPRHLRVQHRRQLPRQARLKHLRAAGIGGAPGRHRARAAAVRRRAAARADVLDVPVPRAALEPLSRAERPALSAQEPLAVSAQRRRRRRGRRTYRLLRRPPPSDPSPVRTRWLEPATRASAGRCRRAGRGGGTVATPNRWLDSAPAGASARGV